jgi:hypothetical protein
MIVTLEIPDSEATFFLNLIRKFDFVRVNQTQQVGLKSVQKEFIVVEVAPTDYKFDREELNERI